jgi:hypothetical protein
MMAKDWTKLLTDAIYVQRIYSRPPDLSKVSLYEAVLDRDASMLKLRFDVYDYPDKPPEKWIARRFNCVQFTLVVIDISKLYITGWMHDIIGCIKIEKIDSGVRVMFSSEGVRIECEGRFLSLSKVTGFVG